MNETALVWTALTAGALGITAFAFVLCLIVEDIARGLRRTMNPPPR